MEQEKSEARSIGEVMLTGSHLVPATQKSQPLKSGELQLLSAISEKRISEESPENIDELFKHCFLLVGLRERNFPNELEGMFLHQFLKENFGGHSISEIKLAFTKAVKGELGLGLDEVKCYENFSVLYLSSIINSYRVWAGEEYRRLEKHIPPTADELKRIEAPKEQPHWGFLIEQAYQHFLSFVGERWQLFPVAFYDQLVTDELVDAELFRKAMPIVRKKLIGEIQREMAKLQMRTFQVPDKYEGDMLLEEQRMLSAKTRNETRIKKFEEEKGLYETGEKDGDIETAAKQYCVLQFFKNSKQSMKQHVYVAAE